MTENGQTELFIEGLIPETTQSETTAVSRTVSVERDFPFDCSAQAFAAMEIVRLRARTTLNSAVKTGTVVKPDHCQHCLGSGKLTGHHHDYSRPLDVTWMCAPCHRKETRRIAALARAELRNSIHTPGFKGIPSWAVRAIKKGQKATA